jgi:arylsulfatase A-like enzyme
LRQHPDVVLVVLESFRADAVGASLNGRAVTPVIDELALRGVSADAAYSHNGYTVQARHHIFSGSVADIRGGTSLIDDFKANGYETAYFSGQDESFGGSAYGVGFDRADVAYDARVDRDKRYSTFSTAGSLAVPNGLLLSRVTDFLERRNATKPLFLYVNFHDTHFPYHHAGIEPLVNSAPLAQKDITPDHLGALRATYLNTAANVDRAIGRLLEEARRRLGHDPGIIVVADHGESLFDEGFLGHGYALNEVQTRVPLVVANLPLVLTEPIGQADLRDAVRMALERPMDHEAPRIERSESKRVFQYLGTFDRPAEIAFTGLRHQIVYDFRDDRVRVDHGRWAAPPALSADDAAAWRDLVNTWERMRLAASP